MPWWEMIRPVILLMVVHAHVPAIGLWGHRRSHRIRLLAAPAKPKIQEHILPVLGVQLGRVLSRRCRVPARPVGVHAVDGHLLGRLSHRHVSSLVMLLLGDGVRRHMRRGGELERLLVRYLTLPRVHL